MSGAVTASAAALNTMSNRRRPAARGRERGVGGPGGRGLRPDGSRGAGTGMRSASTHGPMTALSRRTVTPAPIQTGGMNRASASIRAVSCTHTPGRGDQTRGDSTPTSAQVSSSAFTHAAADAGSAPLKDRPSCVSAR